MANNTLNPNCTCDDLKTRLGKIIYLLNNGSDNTEYLRGQIEMAVNLIGYDNDNVNELREEMERWANNNG